jgi:two-component system NtrC family sensor kinase
MKTKRDGAQHTVLIVDDDKNTRETLGIILKAGGYSIMTASSGKEALSFLDAALPSLVLSDVSMPGMDGFELCRRLKNDPKTAHVPVVLVTGMISDEDLEKGIEAGADDYVKKPCDKEEILLRLRNILRLSEAHRKQRQLFDCASQGIMAVAIDTKIIVMINRAMCAMLGYGEDELLGMSIGAIHPSDAREEIDREFAAHGRKEKSTAWNVPFKHKDGRMVYADISTSVIQFDDAMCVVGFYTEATERMKIEAKLRLDEDKLLFMEAELRHAQKMEAVGRLASGIAHEINTPTQFVGDNTRFLQQSFADLIPVIDSCVNMISAVRSGNSAHEAAALCEKAMSEADIDYLKEEIPKAAKQSLEGIERVATIVRAMKEFAHPGSKEKTHVDLNRLIESTVTVSRNEWKYTADMKLDLSPLPLVHCLPGEINQVLLNLIVNAAHTISDAAKLNGSNDKGMISISTKQTNGHVEIRIKDTGMGIPEDIRDKIMEPFFTTKEVGRGTGQGLAIARSVIVDKHHGKLSFESEVGHGTIFVIVLPLEAGDSQEKGE